jgi:Raf kinase inhibitor-like YbhB/YbcL family protein
MTSKLKWTAALAASLMCVAACGGDDAGTGAATAGSGGTPVLTGGAGAVAAGVSGGSVGAAGSGGVPAANGGSGGASAAGVGGAAGHAAGGGSGGMLAAGAGGKAAGGMGGAGSGAGTGGNAAAGSGGSSGGAFALTSPVVKEGELLPADYRCAKPSPALTWTAGPAGTMSYAIVFKDTTAGSVTMNTMHWAIYDIPASVTSLPMGVMTGPTLTDPAGAKQGKNYKGENGFTGPCGGMNTYKFTLYALKVATLPGLSASSMDAQVETAAEGMSKLASTVLNVHSMP